jgi:predicted ribosome quality control (RQC) complex YloA/Tae2 family protein
MDTIHLTKQALSELTPLVLGGRVERVRNLDEGTLLVSIYSRKKRYLLVASVMKRSMRLHLLFEPVCKEYLYSSPRTDLLNRYIARGRIYGVSCFGRGLADWGVCFSVHREKDFSLLVDFSNADILLRDSEGNAIVSLQDGSPKGREMTEDVVHGKSDEGDFSVNRELCANRELARDFFEEKNERLSRELLKMLRTEEKKTERLLKKLGEEDDEAKQKERYRRWGELLKYNLDRVSKGASSVTVRDFDEKEVEISLDPKLTPVQNMDILFERYRKMKRREAGSAKRIEGERARLERIEGLKRKISQGEIVGLQRPPSILFEAPEIDMIGRGFSQKVRRLLSKKGLQKRAPTERRAPFLRFVSASGKTLLVGRNADENDELVRRVARGKDLWFHAEGVSGSHVLLRYEKQGEFTEEDVRDACLLAFHFSRLRSAGSGAVVYTFMKHVKKPKGSKKGHVEYYSNKTKIVTLQERALARILNSGRNSKIT